MKHLPEHNKHGNGEDTSNHLPQIYTHFFLLSKKMDCETEKTEDPEIVSWNIKKEVKKKKDQQRAVMMCCVLCGADRDNVSPSNMISQFPFDYFVIKVCPKRSFESVIVSVHCWSWCFTQTNTQHSHRHICRECWCNL